MAGERHRTIRPLIIVVMALTSCSSSPNLDDLETAQIETVHVDLRKHEVEFLGFSYFDPFDVAREDIPTVVDLFSGGEPDAAMEWKGLGRVVITEKTGREIAVWIYYTGEETGAFGISGKQYRGPSDQEVMETLLRCSQRSKKSP